MPTSTKINDAVYSAPLRELLSSFLASVNLSKKNCGSVTASDAVIRLSTAGDYAINGVLYNKAASSSVWALGSLTTVPVSKECQFLLLLDSAGSGTVAQGDIGLIGSTVLPAVPSGKCPVAKLKVAVGASNAYVPGTTTFSQVISNAGSVTITDIMSINSDT